MLSQYEFVIFLIFYAFRYTLVSTYLEVPRRKPRMFGNIRKHWSAGLGMAGLPFCCHLMGRRLAGMVENKHNTEAKAIHVLQNKIK